MDKRIPLTADWNNSLNGMIGVINLADSPRANFAYEMLKMRPDQHRFEIGYTVNEDGTYTLLEVSLVGKYGPNHPVTLYRRVKDRVRVLIRTLRNKYGRRP